VVAVGKLKRKSSTGWTAAVVPVKGIRYCRDSPEDRPTVIRVRVYRFPGWGRLQAYCIAEDDGPVAVDIPIDFAVTLHARVYEASRH
jgi:hypothetical protein